METIKKLMAETMAATECATKYQLAKVLDLPTQRISEYCAGERAPDEYACLQIAKALGKPLAAVIATVKAASEKDEKRRRAWENYIKQLGGIAASFALGIFVLVTFIVTSTPAEAAPLLDPHMGLIGIM